MWIIHQFQIHLLTAAGWQEARLHYPLVEHRDQEGMGSGQTYGWVAPNCWSTRSSSCNSGKDPACWRFLSWFAISLHVHVIVPMLSLWCSRKRSEPNEWWPWRLLQHVGFTMFLPIFVDVAWCVLKHWTGWNHLPALDYKAYPWIESRVVERDPVHR